MIEILLVEDNASDAELTLHALRKQKLANRIQHVQDGVEALDFLFCRGPFAGRDARNGPHLILLDLKLPKVNGLEVLAEVKGNMRTRRIPVVVLTSSREDRDLVESYMLGVNSYIQKPVDFSEFQNVVKQLGMYWLLINAKPPAVEAVAKDS